MRFKLDKNIFTRCPDKKSDYTIMILNVIQLCLEIYAKYQFILLVIITNTRKMYIKVTKQACICTNNRIKILMFISVTKRRYKTVMLFTDIKGSQKNDR